MQSEGARPSPHPSSSSTSISPSTSRTRSLVHLREMFIHHMEGGPHYLPRVLSSKALVLLLTPNRALSSDEINPFGHGAVDWLCLF